MTTAQHRAPGPAPARDRGPVHRRSLVVVGALTAALLAAVGTVALSTGAQAVSDPDTTALVQYDDVPWHH